MSIPLPFPVVATANGRRASPWRTLLLGALLAFLAACGGGGGGGGGSSAPVATGVAPVIATQPASATVADGQAVAFTVGAAGTAPLTYQWSRGGVPIAGATGATYSIAGAQLSDNAATFTVAVTNASGTAVSGAATLTVTPVAPTLASSVASTVTVMAGMQATFSVTVAGGSLPLTLQWRRNGVAIAGANASTYTLPGATAADSGAVFDVVVSNASGTVTSAATTLIVTPLPQAPMITTPPQSATVRVGDTATFNVAASGTAPLAYQWLRNGQPIAGAQMATYVLAGAMTGDSGAQFSVTVSNPVGAVTSAPVLLTVLPQPGIALYAGNIGGSGTSDGTGSAARFTTPSAVALDPAGNAYVADGSAVRKVTAGGLVSTFAGSPTTSGSLDGSASTATFATVSGIAVDSAGTVFVADRVNQTIRRISAGGAVTTFAGTNGVAGTADGPASTASFNAPSGIAVDAAGNVYVADTGNQTIRRIGASGVVTTLAGTSGVAGAADGIGVAASFSSPAAVAVDAASNVYVADLGNATIRKITPAGVVTTLAGTAGARGAVDGPGAAARFDSPIGIATDGAGNVYVGDGLNATVRRVSPAGLVTTIAGMPHVYGAADGTGAAASFSPVVVVASDASGALTIADRDNFEVRTVTTAGVVGTLAGVRRAAGGADGTGTAATFTVPDGLAIDAAGVLYVSDAGNGTIRKIASNGAVSTLAGTAGQFGTADGLGAAARFSIVRALAVSATGTVYATDFGSNTIRAITPAGSVTTLAGNPSVRGSADGTGSAASFNGPTGVAVDAAGNLYVVDTLNSTIRRVTPAGVVTTLAGSAGQVGAADGVGAAASFNVPSGITIDGSGNLFVTDTGNATIRKVTPTGVVSTVAGVAGQVGSANGGSGVATFSAPFGIAADGSGNLYVADTGNGLVRLIDGSGAVSTVAGVANGRRGVRLGGLPGALSQPLNLAIGANRTVYCSDENGILAITLP